MNFDCAKEFAFRKSCEEIVVKDQGVWVPARPNGCRATDIAGQIWRCRRSYHEGVQEYKGTFKQEQHYWGVTRGDKAQLDLNSMGIKVVEASGQHTCSLLPCKECKESREVLQ